MANHSLKPTELRPPEKRRPGSFNIEKWDADRRSWAGGLALPINSHANKIVISIVEEYL